MKGKKHILKKQNPNFVFGKKKKAWFIKFIVLKNHFLEMKLKVSFSKCTFNKTQSFFAIFIVFEIPHGHMAASHVFQLRKMYIANKIKEEKRSYHRILIHIHIHIRKVQFKLLRTFIRGTQSWQLKHVTKPHKHVMTSM